MCAVQGKSGALWLDEIRQKIVWTEGSLIKFWLHEGVMQEKAAREAR